MEKISVLLVDDHPLVREGLVSLLSQYPGIRVVAEADGVSTALEQAAKLRPEVVLLDIRLEDGNGIELARQLRQQQRPAGRVLHGLRAAAASVAAVAGVQLSAVSVQLSARRARRPLADG